MPEIENKKQAIISQRDISLLLRVFKSNWWVPLLFVGITYAIGTFYVYRLTIVYKASTEFLLQSEDAYYKNSVLSEENFYNFNSYVDNSNETRVIQSYDLASKVVDKLIDDILVSYYIVGKVRTTEQFVGMPFKIVASSINPNLCEQVFDFRILNYDEYEIAHEVEGKIVKLKGQFNKELVDLDLRIRVDRNENFTKMSSEVLKDIFYQFVVHSKEYLITNLRNNLAVENPEFTRVLKVSLKDVIAERAVLILDTLNSVYAQNKLKAKYELNERTVDYIEKQLNEIKYSLKSIEDTMQDYIAKKAIINLDWEQKDFLEKISSFDKEKSVFEIQSRALNDLEKYIIEDKDPQFLPPNVFISEKEGFMSHAVTELYSKQIELNRLFSEARDSNPAIEGLKKSIAKTKADLLVYITNTRKAVNSQIISIDKEIWQYANDAKLIPTKQRDILNIQRQASVSEELYNFLLEKKASTKIAKASIVPDVKIIEAPRSVGIDSPNKAKTLNQFVSAGLLVSLIVIIIRSFFYTKIISVEYLKEITKLPLVGVLPRDKLENTQGITVFDKPHSFLAESFRNFWTNLQYASVDQKGKTFLITSYLPGEGKTFTSVNLATILAKSGKKTVIIELDLHKPSIYKRFGLSPREEGITTYITGNTPLDDIIKPSVIENLYCIFAGPIPPNPSEFVLSDKMKDLIDYVKERFDYVIIDTPPAGLLSDAIYLVQHVDFSVFVLNTRTSNKRVVNFVEDLVENNNLRNIFFLLNGVAAPKKRYYHPGYGYNYGYYYGYGYGKGNSRKA